MALEQGLEISWARVFVEMVYVLQSAGQGPPRIHMLVAN